MHDLCMVHNLRDRKGRGTRQVNVNAAVGRQCGVSSDLAGRGDRLAG